MCRCGVLPVGPDPSGDEGRPRALRTWSRGHPAATLLITAVVGILVGIGIASPDATPKGASSATPATVTTTDTVARVRTVTRGRVRTVVKRAPARPASTVTVTTTATHTTTLSAAAAPAPSSASVEGPGSASHATDDQFCSTHTCIPSFADGHGTVVQCSDGEWSHSGGLSGACSDHGGEA
jgi:hypothetical protein